MPSAYFEPSGQKSLSESLAAATERCRTLADACSRAAERCSEALVALQKPEGYWCGDLLADSTLESDYVLVQLWLHPPQDGLWNPPSWSKMMSQERAL